MDLGGADAGVCCVFDLCAFVRWCPHKTAQPLTSSTPKHDSRTDSGSAELEEATMKATVGIRRRHPLHPVKPPTVHWSNWWRIPVVAVVADDSE